MTTKHRDDWPMRFARDSTDRRRRASCLHFRLDRGLDIHRSRRSPHDRRYRKFVTKGIGETKAEIRISSKAGHVPELGPSTQLRVEDAVPDFARNEMTGGTNAF